MMYIEDDGGDDDDDAVCLLYVTVAFVHFIERSSLKMQL